MSGIPVRTEIVDYFAPWEALPDLGSVETPTRPADRAPRESIQIDFTEAQMRTRILAVENGFGGLRCTTETLNVLPEGWLTSVYTNIRYMAMPGPGVFPIVGGSSYATNAHALAALTTMSLLFQSLWDEYRFYVKPDEVKRANDVKRRLNQINYVLYQSLLTNASGLKGSEIIVGNLLVATSVGVGTDKVVEQTRWLYFDRVTFQTYLDAGGTLEAAIDHYVTTGTQPTV